MPYRDKNGKSWVGQFKIKNPITGNIEKRKSRGHLTQKAARDWEKKEKEKTRLLYSTDKKNMLLYQLVFEYLKNEKSKLERLQKDEDKKAFLSGWRYFDEKKGALEKYAQITGVDCVLSTIEPEHVLDYMSGQQRTGRTNNSINKDRKHIVAMFSFFEKKYLKQFNPAKVVPPLEHIPKQTYTPPVDDFLALLDACPLDEFHFFMLYVSSGARRSELFRLKWETDVDFEREIIRLGSRKGKDRKLKHTWIPMAPDARLALEYFHENRVNDEQRYVLVSHQKGPHYGKPFSKRQKVLDMYCALAGVKRFGYHALRRVYIQTLGESGAVGINQLRMLARHSSLATTSKYSHTPDSAMHQAAQHVGLAALQNRSRLNARQATPAKIIPIEERRKKANE
jgi:site-specific recombinase XerD